MKRVLFIAYEFAPLKLGGVYRPLGFVKYLKDFGYEPIIITLSLEAIEKYSKNNQDYFFGENEINNNIIIRVATTLKHAKQKSKFQNFKDIYFNPNGYEDKYWRANFLPAVNKAINEYQPQLVFVTAPPFSVVSLAIEVARKYNLPLVTDLRDAWTNWFTVPYATYWHYWYKKRKERIALEKSTIVTVTSKQTIKDFIQLNPSVDKNKFCYLPNGYNGELKEWVNDLGKKEKIKIGYVGSFYFTPQGREIMMKPWYKNKPHRLLRYLPNKQDWLYRTPYFFFKALNKLFQTNPELKEKIEVEFAGENADWLQQMINEFELSKNVTLLGYINHKESLLFQRNCDLLLITSAKVIGGKDYSIAGKTFEYFQNQKPILSFACEGAQKEILEESGMAIICNPDDINNSAEKLMQAFLGKIELKPNLIFLQEHARKKLTQSLAQIFDKLVTS